MIAERQIPAGYPTGADRLSHLSVKEQVDKLNPVPKSRSRFQDPVLAERLIWELLGQPKPEDGRPVAIEISVAEQAIRDLILPDA